MKVNQKVLIKDGGIRNKSSRKTKKKNRKDEDKMRKRELPRK
jgi:hypothetical protein